MTSAGRTEQLALNLPHRPARGMDDFLVADSNAEAVAWLDRWPEWPTGAVAFHGPPGSGKSHLAHVFAEQTGAPVIAAGGLTANDVMTLDPRAAVVEDGEHLIDEAALLHLLNWMRENRGTLLLTGRQAPARWPVALPDLASRLAAIPVAALGPPDEPLLAAVLVKLLTDRQAPAGREVVDYVVPRIVRSFAALQAFVVAADRLSLARQKAITVPLAREALDMVNQVMEES